MAETSAQEIYRRRSEISRQCEILGVEIDRARARLIALQEEDGWLWQELQKIEAKDKPLATKEGRDG